MADLHLLSPAGFRAGAVAAKIKTSGKLDVGILAADKLATAAAIFTTNRVIAAPVKVGRENIAAGRLRAIVVNSGNANACTGKQGEIDARQMCALAAKELDCPANQVLPSSTGIIGHLMPMDKIRAGIAAASSALGKSSEHALQFADAILTTDLVRKSAAAQFKVGKETITLAGVCKGSGMIGPRLALPASAPKHATMLAYLTIDAQIPAPTLRKLLMASADVSFNAVTVDDHSSTNDTLAILASGVSGKIDSPGDLAKLRDALNDVCQSLAYQIAADGEGATKVVRIDVRGAASLADAQAMARAIANSPLVKCAFHGNDPNWGRIVSAAGMCGAKFDADKATLKLQGTVVFRSGTPAKFDTEAVSKSLATKFAAAELTCRLGKHDATVWTCDLSREYITINADYHT